MAAIRGIDREQVRQLCARRPALSYVAIGRMLGVSGAAISYLARQMGIQKPMDRGGYTLLECERRAARFAPTPTRWRCARCGGQRDTQHAHACRPAEPLSMGLTWERLA